jgi:hypothetical protein
MAIATGNVNRTSRIVLLLCHGGQAHAIRVGRIGVRHVPLKGEGGRADRAGGPAGQPFQEVPRVERYRRVLTSLGWVAAFVMAVGAGWKNS